MSTPFKELPATISLVNREEEAPPKSNVVDVIATDAATLQKDAFILLDGVEGEASDEGFFSIPSLPVTTAVRFDKNFTIAIDVTKFPLDFLLSEDEVMDEIDVWTAATFTLNLTAENLVNKQIFWLVIKDGIVIKQILDNSPRHTFNLAEELDGIEITNIETIEIKAITLDTYEKKTSWFGRKLANFGGNLISGGKFGWLAGIHFDKTSYNYVENEIAEVTLSCLPARQEKLNEDGESFNPPQFHPEFRLHYMPFVARINAVNDNIVELDTTWTNQVRRINPLDEGTTSKQATDTFTNFSIIHKQRDFRDLNTYLHFGDDKRYLVVNAKLDTKTITSLPYSVIFKTYEPLPDDISEKDELYVVQEILPSLTETVELIGYDQEDEDFQVLIPRDSYPKESPITKRATEFKTYDDLVTTDSQLKDDIEDKFLNETPSELSVDYSNYENFINFSSAEKRLKNFKYKIEQIEEETAKSASFVGIPNGEIDLKTHHNNIRNIKTNFDGYEKYLYNIKSTYVSSSMGEFHNASWPKDGTGTYEDPYKPVSSSHSDFTDWYGSIASKTGQLYSASFYDTENGNRLVNLLPEHVRDDSQNIQFLDFMDMIGQQFDELWSYIKAMSDISDRRLDLEDGFSKDLIFNLAKSLGWEMQDGKDLLDLSRYGFGRKLSGESYSLYTSGSLSAPVEADVSKEITKRLIASMPFILKSKGTKASLKAILNCYGIPSTILRIREYGGMDNSTQRSPFETKRRFTRALGFRGDQYVSSSWTDDSDTGRKPETVELRFRSVNSSDQVLIQKDDEWAIKLKDNGNSDNMGTVAFVLSGSTGHKEVSSSLLPVFDGDYYSLMLKKEKVDLELFKYPSFNATTIFNPPFVSGSTSATFGNIQIVSSSNVSRTGTKSLRHRNTATLDSGNISYTLGFNTGSQPSSVASVSAGETYIFSAFAKASGSTVDSVGRLRMFELDSNENIVNWDEDVNSNQVSITALGGIKTSETIGLIEDEWKQISVTKTIRFSNTSKLGIRFENVKPQSTIFWDDVSVRKVPTSTDSISDGINYQLFVKKYSAGLDRIIQSSNTSLYISGSNTASSSYNASWTGSGGLFIGGKISSPFGSQLTGSLMEFRLWNESLKEQFFDNHVSDPKSYVGNTPSSSYDSLIVRYSFDDNTTLSNGDTIRDVSSNQTTTIAGNAQGFGGLNTFESVVDETKTFIPNYGPNRRSSDKIRIEDNFLSGSGVNLSTVEKYDFSSNDFSPVDSPKLGIYFSPTDVVNDDIISSFANLDFNQMLGDPRDNFRLEYRDLKDSSNKYFQKYTGNNDFWDYMHLIKYYDQSVFKQIRKLIPMRAKPVLGTVIEPNIFERSKNPIQRNNPSFTQIDYGSKINVTNFHYNSDTDGAHQEASHSILKIETEYPYYEGEIDSSDTFRKPSLYEFTTNDNFDDRNTYISGAVNYGGPSYVFTEATGAMAVNQRLSELNQEYKYFYNSVDSYSKSSRFSMNPFENLYSSRSLHPSDRDTSYQHTTALRRMFYEGVKNTSDTTLDGDLPVIVTMTAPTVAVPTNKGISKLSIDQKNSSKKIIPKK